MADLAQRTFNRILLLKPSSLGDVIHALPVLHGLRARFPQAKIDWLIAPAFAPLLIGQDDLNEAILFDRRRFSRIGRSAGATVAFAAFIRDLRRRRYDLLLDLQGLFRTGWMAWATGAPVRIGFRGVREGAWVFYTHRIHIDDPNAHAVDRNYRVAGLLGFAEVPVEFGLVPVESAVDEARHLLRAAGIADGQRWAAIVPGARWETKVWIPERFAEVVDRLQQGRDLRCVMLGSPDEATTCDRIAGASRSGPVNLAGRTGLPQLTALIALADVVLCHDSAATHLAAALGRPLVCLVGPTNPTRTGPYQRMDDVVRAGVACAPCYLRRLSQCRYGHRCMRELGVDVVERAVNRAVAAGPADPG